MAALSVSGQLAPLLSITNESPDSIRAEWPSETNVWYRLLSTEAIDPFSHWTPIQDVYATETNSSATVPIDVPIRFFKLHVLNEYAGLPTAHIIGPTNGDSVSGTISVWAGAQDDSQLVSVNLYMDEALIGYIDSGSLEFPLDTTHFVNGSHTIYITARDDSDNAVTSAPPVVVSFQNTVRWTNAETLFESFVPITVESDVFPANWTVFVETLQNQSVRTFSGSTSDGIILTNWDGLDQNGILVPDQNAYRITVVVEGSGSFAMSSSTSERNAENDIIAVGPNPFGCMDYEREEPVVDMVAAYYETFKWYYDLPESKRAEQPPIPPPPPAAKPGTKTRVSAREALFAPRVSNTSEAVTEDAAGGGSSQTVVWMERPWNSAKTLLARQKITGTPGIVYDGVTANMLVNIRNRITLAAQTLGDSRGVFQDAIFVMQNNGDYSGLTNNLAANDDVRAFYFYGHGSPSGNTIGSGYVSAAALGATLVNLYTMATNGPAILTTHPFSFVFLDGCMTGNGNFPEAFGIPKIIPEGGYRALNKKKRAFMGWGAKASNSILNNEFINWTERFWQEWLNDPNYNRSLGLAYEAACYAYPSATNQAPMKIYGATSLTWRE